MEEMLLTGYYQLKAENPQKINSDFILIRLTEEQKNIRLQSLPKPTETSSFTTGEKIKNFSEVDINGNKYDLKGLNGKIVVLNFWFINCEPCRNEILELNKLVNDYKDSSNIVFLAIALDRKYELKEFVKHNTFAYNIIDEGSALAFKYNVTEYPTHAVIDQQGRVYFHTAGAGSRTIYWLRKSISELMNLR